MPNYSFKESRSNKWILICKYFDPDVINVEIVFGHHAGIRVLLSRIPFSPSEEEIFPFKLKRKRFPMRLGFAMTINKARGQTIPNVGVYLSDSGQLYVALFSRISRKTTKVLMNLVQEYSQEGVYTSTVVYQGVLRDK